MSDLIYWAIISVIGVTFSMYFFGVAGAVGIAIICIFGGLMQILEKKLHPDIFNSHLHEAPEQNEK